MLLSLVIGVQLRGIVARLNQKLDGPLEIAAALEVHRQLRRNPRCLLAVMLKQLFARLPVQQDAALADQFVIQNVLIKRMGEPIAHRQRAVRQFLFAQGRDQTMHSFEVGKLLFEIQLVSRQQFSGNRGEEFFALNAGISQGAPL